MLTKTMRGLLMSTFMVTALPAVADQVAPAMMGATTMGDSMVNTTGMALYTFDTDTDVKSMCNGECAIEWPPLPVAADAMATGDWTIVVRDDGTRMWAYKGHPLYTFVDDKAPGEVTGDGVDGFHLATNLAVSGAEVNADIATAAAIMGTTTKGTGWVDANGMTLYNYEKDVDRKSMCYDECAVEWPPLMAAADAKASGDMTIITRDDGIKQWVLFGRPLYTFVDDKAPGEVTGDNVDGFHLAM